MAQLSRWHHAPFPDLAGANLALRRLDQVLNDAVVYDDQATTFTQMVTFAAGVTFGSLVTINPGPLVIGADPGGSELLRVGSGGRFSGNVTIAKTSPVYAANDTGAASDPLTLAYLSFQRAGTERGWVGFGEGSSGRMRLKNSIGDLYLSALGGTWLIDSAGHLIPEVNNSSNIGDATHRVANLYAKQLQLIDDVTGGNPYIAWTWKNAGGTARSGYLEATNDSMRFYSNNLGGGNPVLTMDWTTGKLTANAGTGADFYAAGFRRSAGNAAFPDLYGDGTNALVLAGKNDGTGIIKLGTLGANLLFTDNTFDIGAAGANRPRDLYLAGNLTAGGTVTATDVKLRFSTTTSVGTGAATAETDLMTHTLPTLANGDKVDVFAEGLVTGVASTKTVRIKVGGTTLGTITCAAGTAGDYFFHLQLVKDGATLRYTATTSPDTLGTTPVMFGANAGVDLSGAIVKTTGQTPNAADEVTTEAMTIVITKA